MPTLDNDGKVWILHLGDDENRFNPEWMTAVSAALDEVAAKPQPRALVTTARGKIWSNGLDLDWLSQNQDRVQEFVDQVHDLLAKFLVAPLPRGTSRAGRAPGRRTPGRGPGSARASPGRGRSTRSCRGQSSRARAAVASPRPRRVLRTRPSSIQG